MKIAKIVNKELKDEGNKIILETEQDVLDYSEWLSNKCVELSRKVVASSVPVDRMDHFYGKGHEGGIWAVAVMKAKFNGINPLFNIHTVIEEKVNNLMKSVRKGETILLNDVGGYRWLLEDDIVNEVLEYSEKFVPTHCINKNTQYINLENDPKLESHSIDYLEKVDSNYSYVLNLRAYSICQLVEVFEEFKANGGHTVYVYTTGMDDQQMYDYLNAACRAKIPNMIIEFNAGTTCNTEAFCDFAETQSINFKSNITVAP